MTFIATDFCYGFEGFPSGLQERKPWPTRPSLQTAVEAI
jgi:hypothetical protein